MRIFALLLALFCVTFVDAAPRRVGNRAGGRRVARAIRGGRAAIRGIRRFVAPIIIGRQTAPIIVGRVSAFRTQQIVARRIVSAQRIVVPTYQAYVAPQQIVSQDVATDQCGIQQVTVARDVTGYSGGCGSMAAFRSH